MIAACYSMDLYCENRDPERHGYRMQPKTFTGETWGECVQQARAKGWKISRDRQHCWCPKCSGKNRT